MKQFEKLLKCSEKKLNAYLKFEPTDPKIELDYENPAKISSHHSTKVIPLKNPIHIRIFYLEPNELKFEQNRDTVDIILENSISNKLNEQFKEKLGVFDTWSYRGEEGSRPNKTRLLHRFSINKDCLFYHNRVIQKEGICGGNNCDKKTLIYYCDGCSKYFCKGNCLYMTHEHLSMSGHKCKDVELLKYADLKKFREVLEMKTSENIITGINLGFIINNMIEINGKHKPHIKLCAIQLENFVTIQMTHYNNKN